MQHEFRNLGIWSAGLAALGLLYLYLDCFGVHFFSSIGIAEDIASFFLTGLLFAGGLLLLLGRWQGLIQVLQFIVITPIERLITYIYYFKYDPSLEAYLIAIGLAAILWVLIFRSKLLKERALNIMLSQKFFAIAGFLLLALTIIPKLIMFY